MWHHAVLVLVPCLLVITTALNVRKCCKENQRFNLSETECQDLEQGANNSWWLPPIATDNKQTISLANLTVLSKEAFDCEPRETLIIHVASKVHRFALVLNNNEIQLEVLKEGVIRNGKPGQRTLFPNSAFCVDAHAPNIFAAVICPCDVLPCVRKCCSANERFNVNDGNCSEVDNAFEDTISHEWVPKVKDNTVGDVYYWMKEEMPSCNGRHILRNEMEKANSNESHALLLDKRNIQVLENDELNEFPLNEFCGEYSTTDDKEIHLFCHTPSVKSEVIAVIYGTFFIIGAICLFITVVLTIILPNMRKNIHGKMTFCHNVALLVGSIVIGTVQLSTTTYSKTTCIFIAFIMQFSFLASLFWLNVMCIDIAWVFSALRPIPGVSTQTSQKKFTYYSLYAWGSTCCISIITAIVEFTPGETLKPGFGTSKCLFNDWYAELVLFEGPLGLLLVINTVLFIFTAVKIIKTKMEASTAVRSTSNNRNNQDFILYAKLFTVMGITWIFEVVSWALGRKVDEIYWVVPDVIHLLRGVFIFIIFCCKKSVYTDLCTKVRHVIGMVKDETNESLTASKSASTEHGKLELLERKTTDGQ